MYFFPIISLIFNIQCLSKFAFISIEFITKFAIAVLISYLKLDNVQLSKFNANKISIVTSLCYISFKMFRNICYKTQISFEANYKSKAALPPVGFTVHILVRCIYWHDYCKCFTKNLPAFNIITKFIPQHSI